MATYLPVYPVTVSNTKYYSAEQTLNAGIYNYAITTSYSGRLQARKIYTVRFLYNNVTLDNVEFVDKVVLQFQAPIGQPAYLEMASEVSETSVFNGQCQALTPITVALTRLDNNSVNLSVTIPVDWVLPVKMTLRIVDDD